MDDLESLIESITRGDPESPLRWSCKSTRKLAEELGQTGHDVSHVTISGTVQFSSDEWIILFQKLFNLAGSNGFCGFQQILKESGIIPGSEEIQLMRTGCETPRFPYIRGLLLATTENSRTRKFVVRSCGVLG